MPEELSRLDSENISSRKARPLKIRPSPNLRGIDGLFRPSLIQTQASSGAKVRIATELTDWNQATGKIQSPSWRSTILSARKLNELPACSKNIQNSTLNAKMISIASALSRATGPSRTPSIMIIAHRATNSRSEEHTSELQSLMRISNAVFCLQQKKQYNEKN